MIHIEDSVVFDELLEHIGYQRVKANLVNEPFELGIVTDKKPSQILSLVHQVSNLELLTNLGMAKYQWHDDALRSELRLAGENLLISVCRPR